MNTLRRKNEGTNGGAYTHLTVIIHPGEGFNDVRKVELQTASRRFKCKTIATGLYYPTRNQWTIYFKKPWTRKLYRLTFTSRIEMINLITYVLQKHEKHWSQAVKATMLNGQLTRKENDDNDYWAALYGPEADERGNYSSTN